LKVLNFIQPVIRGQRTLKAQQIVYGLRLSQHNAASYASLVIQYKAIPLDRTLPPAAQSTSPLLSSRPAILPPTSLFSRLFGGEFLFVMEISR
jgi:hypothetical protein